AFAGDKGAASAAGLGTTRGLGEQTTLEAESRADALGQASRRGMELRDGAIDAAGQLLLGRTADSTRGLKTAATSEFDRLEQRARIATERRNQNLALGTAVAGTLATSGASLGKAYYDGGKAMDALRANPEA